MSCDVLKIKMIRGSNFSPEPRFEDHIIRGERADVAEFPHFASLGYQGETEEYQFLCGGTLISENFVLTAAHCNQRVLKPLIVRLGKVRYLIRYSIQ